MRIWNNKFCQQIACIVVDKKHLIWEWKQFQKKYEIINHLKDLFSKVVMLALSGMVTPNVLDYISTWLKLWLSIQLYKKLFNYPNLIYIIAKIRKPKFKKLAFVMSLIATTFCIPKTMIFINNIDNAGEISNYFQTCFLDRLQNKRHILI